MMSWDISVSCELDVWGSVPAKDRDFFSTHHIKAGPDICPSLVQGALS
jgi:hypothetical protein